MKEDIPVLVGEAAKSYVQLKWAEFYFAGTVVVVLVLVLGFIAWKLRNTDLDD